MKKRIVTTDLLFTAKGEPLVNGMIAINEHNKIEEVGTNLTVNNDHVEYYKGAICPGFINTHCHLELSHLKGKVSQKTGLDGFIQELQQVREASEEEVLHAISQADQEMIDQGIAAVGDISNGSSTFPTKSNSRLHYHNFVELFGFDASMATEIFDRGKALKEKASAHGLSSSIVPHSPYSVSSSLFELIAEENSSCLSIHNQETASENELYIKGSGQLAEMLEGFGLDIKSFTISGKNSLPTYLKYFGLNSPLLLVHNTYTSLEDIRLAEELNNNLYWCFCPKANLFIEGQLPNIPLFVKEKVKCTLGTDSLASNNTLSIWEEIKTIKNHFEEIDLNTLIKWATINGAEFLKIEKLYGSIEVGKEANINWFDNYTDIKNSTLRPI